MQSLTASFNNGDQLTYYKNSLRVVKLHSKECSYLFRYIGKIICNTI